jgi:transposase
MRHASSRLGPNDVIVGLDLASKEHQAVVMDTNGKRLTRFRLPHSRKGFEELLRRTEPSLLNRPGNGRVFAFEATGHIWEAVAHALQGRGEAYLLVNPLATFRVREARQMDRQKTDLTDAEQIAELVRAGMVTRTQLEARPYLELRRAWGEYARLRSEKARLKTHLTHQLYGLFPEFVGNWSDVLQPGALAVLRLGLTPYQIAALPLNEFWLSVREARRGRRLWRFKIEQIHERAQITVACPFGSEAMAREAQRVVERIDQLASHMEQLTREIDAQLEALEETRYLRTIPGLGWTSVAGFIAHIGAIDKYQHGRQLVKLAGTNPSRRDTGLTVGRGQSMTHRGRAGLREAVFLATISCLQHNPRIRAHYDRLIQRAGRPLTKMQAIGACMNKLLLYAFAVMKRREEFDSSHRWRRQMYRQVA